MECLVQYLDDLEDLLFAVALKAERIRQVVRFFLFMITAATLQVRVSSSHSKILHWP